MQLATGLWVGNVVSCVARLKIADALVDGPKTAEALAAKLNLHGPSLHRMLRAAASVGVFAETPAGSGAFALTPVSQLLRTGTAGSMNAAIAMFGADWDRRAWGGLDHAVRTGGPAHHHVYGEGPFEYLKKHPADDVMFNEAMTAYSVMTAAAVTAAYDFAGITTLADIAGGHGKLLAECLKARKHLRGVLFDQPHVIAGAGKLFTDAGVADRVTMVGGSFFEEVPPADAHMMSNILHDWPDVDAVRILKTCRKAAAPGGRVLIIEAAIPSDPGPHPGKFLDIQMMVMTGGRERTEAQFRELFASAGYRLERIVPTPGPMSVVEGRAV
jgi:hypothetical protein